MQNIFLIKYLLEIMLSKAILSTRTLLKETSRRYTKVLTHEGISDNVKQAEYAVRGAIPIRGEEISRLIKQGEKFPFTQTTSLNIGNPQSVGQGHITFNREVSLTILNSNRCCQLC
jgi:hypothetical protein